MRYIDPIKSLKEYGCEFIEESAAHSVYLNPNTGELLEIPKQTELADWLAFRLIQKATADGRRK